MAEPSITDWIGALSAAAGTAVAGVMAYLAYRQYLQPPEQEALPDVPVDAAAEPAAAEKVVFSTSKQETRLAITDDGLECHLRNFQRNTDKLQWRLSKELCGRILNGNSYFADPGYKARTGTFTLGDRRNWLYSKSLFPEPQYLHGELRDLLERASLP
jgi:hypothetical protein